MPLTLPEAASVRRFAGYPVLAAISAQGADIQSASTLLTLVLAGLTDDDMLTVRVMLANLALLDADLPAMREGLDTKQAAVWIRNPEELAERAGLFFAMRRRLCAFLGIPPGPGIYVEFATTTGTTTTTPDGTVVPISTATPAIFIV